MNMQMLCQQHLHQMVQVNTHPYGTYKGFLEQVDHENVSLLVPIDDNGDYMEMDNESLFYSMNGQVPQQMMGARGEERFYPYYPYPYFYPYPYPFFPRPRRWGRLILPLAALTAIAALY